MPAFFSPLENPASWSYSIVEVTIPDELRYAGYTLRGLRATHSPAANVAMPALGILRQAASPAGQVFVEVQLNPFPVRRIATAVPGGLATFYLVFDDATGLTFSDGDSELGGTTLRPATAVTLAVAGQDRVVRDPALWVGQLGIAISDNGGDASQWQPFAAAVDSATNSGPAAPVLLLDHTGRPHRQGRVDIVFGPPGSETIHPAVLDPVDGGDLQQTVARLHATDPGAMPIPNLWGAAGSFRLRPVVPVGGFDFQLAGLEDAASAGTEITVTPAQRHILLTNLHDWFSPQCATPIGLAAPPLARYTRGNRLTPLVNGPAFFDDLFRRLPTANTADHGLHAAGWAIFPQAELTKRRDDDPSNLPLTLEQAAQLIGSGPSPGRSCFLSVQFIQLEPGDTVVPAEILAFDFLVTGILVLNSFGVSFVRTDGTGAFILLALTLANAVLVSHIFSTGGATLEANKPAVDVLNAIANSTSRFSPYPATVDDNPVAPALTSFVFDTIFELVRHFGVYHQKLTIVRNADGYFGYCGGIDLNPNRLDDEHHLNLSPYHDLHSRVEGPAVRDLALSFEQRWSRDGGGEPLAFATPAAADLGTPGSDIVQVARTYFTPADPSRRLDFAPQGDRTLIETVLKAIANAREFIYIEDQYFTPPEVYRTALINKVSSGEIRQLIVVLPGVTDQPFGEIIRSGLISDLQSADAGRGIIRIGYPRRHFTLPENELRAASGKCLLMEDMAAGGGVEPSIFLGPVDRLPVPPFWVAVEGELMYVFDESTLPNPDPDKMKIFRVLRGEETRLVSQLKGAKPREHKKGAAATVISLSGIYVHSKMMIVDDVFVSIGSANLNRRGFYSDGEINVFSVPQALKAGPANPVAALRRQLWAEMLNLPAELAGPLLEDPLAAAALFDRSPLAGNRFTDIKAHPDQLMLGATGGGDGLVGTVLQGLFTTLTSVNHAELFDGVVDPSSALESSTC